MSEPVIRASEIGEYMYCRRAWWLSHVAGYEARESPAVAAGAAYHRDHGGMVWRARVVRWVAYLLVFLAVAVFTYVLVSGWGV